MRFKKDDVSGRFLLRTIINSRDGASFRYDIKHGSTYEQLP